MIERAVSGWQRGKLGPASVHVAAELVRSELPPILTTFVGQHDRAVGKQKRGARAAIRVIKNRRLVVQKLPRRCGAWSRQKCGGGGHVFVRRKWLGRRELCIDERGESQEGQYARWYSQGTIAVAFHGFSSSGRQRANAYGRCRD